MKKNCNLLSPFGYLIYSRVVSFPWVVQHYDLHLFPWGLTSSQASSYSPLEINKKKVFKITIINSIHDNYYLGFEIKIIDPKFYEEYEESVAWPQLM